jgi:hypothetical protein
MGDPANQLNVPSDAPIEKYRTPNVSPQFNTRSTDVQLTAAAQTPVNSDDNVTEGGVGPPVNNGG